MARNLSAELISRGIRFNAVGPGPIDTPLYSKLGLSAPDLAAASEALQNQVPARRFGKPSEIKRRSAQAGWARCTVREDTRLERTVAIKISVSSILRSRYQSRTFDS